MSHPSVLAAALTSVAAWVLVPMSALAQPLPAGPVSAFDGRLAVGAEIVGTVGAEDDDAFFNYTDYEHNTLRMFRVALSASWRPVSRVAVVGEVRSEDLELVRAYAAYVRVRPWSNHPFDVQFGRIPPSFGAFGRRGYQGTDNPLIGYPLAYQYLTSLRPDAAPATVADLLFMRGRGWRASYPSARRNRRRAYRSSPPSAGTPASRRTGRDARSTSPAASRPERSPILSRRTTTTASRCPAAWHTARRRD